MRFARAVSGFFICCAATTGWAQDTNPEFRGDPAELTVAGPQALTEVLPEAGFRVLIAPSDWDSLKEPRMKGIPTYYGNPMSEHAERTLDLAGIGKLFAMSRNAELNKLACTYFAHSFGRDRVYFLPVSLDSRESGSTKHTPSMELAGRRLFSDQVSLSKLLSIMSQGGEIKTTRLSGNYSFKDFLKDANGRHLLVAWNDKGRLEPYAERWKDVLDKDWTVASLGPANASGKA